MRPGTRSSRPPPHADDVLEPVHDPRAARVPRHGAADRWRAGPYDELVGQDRVVPYFFPTPAMLARPARPPGGRACTRDAGRFCYDTMTLVGPGTWEAARAAVDCALTAVDLVVGGRARGLRAVPSARATTRPAPGSAAPATSTTPPSRPRRCADAGHERVAVIDVDAHHGNGTAAIFYDRGRRALRVRARRPGGRLVPARRRPRRRDRHRRGGGGDPQPPARRGHRRRRRGSRPSRELAEWVAAAGCTALVVSLGVDAAEDDPESPLQVTADGYRGAGALLGGTRSAGGGRAGGRLPPPDAGRPGRGVPGRARARRRLMFFCRHLAKPCRCRGSIRAWRTCCPAGRRRPRSPGS